MDTQNSFTVCRSLEDPFIIRNNQPGIGPGFIVPEMKGIKYFITCRFLKIKRHDSEDRKVRVRPGPCQACKGMVHPILTQNPGYSLKQFLATACCNVPLDDVMSAEIIGLMPGVEQLIRIMRPQRALIVPDNQPALFKPANDTAGVALVKTGNLGQFPLSEALVWFD